MSRPPLAIGADADVLAALLAAPGPIVIAVIAAPPSAAARSYVRSAVALAAERRAPAVRVNAILATNASAPDAVSAAAAFLSGAEATTGQTLEIG